MPHLVEMQREFGGEDFTVVGVTEDDESAARGFAADLGATYPILAGAGETFDAWGVSSLPQAYLIDPEGTVVADDVEIMADLLRDAR